MSSDAALLGRWGEKQAAGYGSRLIRHTLDLAEKMGWLGIDPAGIRHILITHQDTGHVGAVEADSPGAKSSTTSTSCRR